MFGGGRNGAGFEVAAGEDEKAEPKVSKPKESFLELLLNVDVFVADPGNGAKGSDPNGSDENPSFAAELFCFSICCLNFRLENGSNDSSRFSDAAVAAVVVDVVAKAPKAAKGSLDDVDADGQADPKGSADEVAAEELVVVEVPPRRLKGSFPPKVAAA